jgi:hypothetical protein
MDSILSKNKLGKVSYSFDLRSSLIRENFIRLRSIDRRGKAAYSNVLYIRPAHEIVHIFPNPCSSILRIGPLKEAPTAVLLLNPIGQVIQATSWLRENQLEVDVSQLNPGKYGLVLNLGGNKRVFPFMKQ